MNLVDEYEREAAAATANPYGSHDTSGLMYDEENGDWVTPEEWERRKIQRGMQMQQALQPPPPAPEPAPAPEPVAAPALDSWEAPAMAEQGQSTITGNPYGEGAPVEAGGLNLLDQLRLGRGEELPQTDFFNPVPAPEPGGVHGIEMPSGISDFMREEVQPRVGYLAETFGNRPTATGAGVGEGNFDIPYRTIAESMVPVTAEEFFFEATPLGIVGDAADLARAGKAVVRGAGEAGARYADNALSNPSLVPEGAVQRTVAPPAPLMEREAIPFNQVGWMMGDSPRMTATAAEITNTQSPWWRMGDPTPDDVAATADLLTDINRAPQARTSLFHGQVRAPQYAQFEVGQEIDLPLAAATRSRALAEQYGTPTTLRLPNGFQSTDEGIVYRILDAPKQSVRQNEDLVTGRFVVEKIEAGREMPGSEGLRRTDGVLDIAPPRRQQIVTLRYKNPLEVTQPTEGLTQPPLPRGVSPTEGEGIMPTGGAAPRKPKAAPVPETPPAGQGAVSSTAGDVAGAAPPPPTEPPTGTGGPPVQPPDSASVSQRLAAAVKTARRLTPEQRRLRSQELSSRVGGFANVMEGARTKDEALRARGMLRGEMPKVSFDAPQFADEEVNTLFAGIAKSDKLPPLTKISAVDALADVISGQIPQPAALNKLARVYPELAEAVRSKRSLGAKAYDEIVGLLGVPQALNTFLDASGTLRQALVPGLGNPTDYWRAINREVKVLASAPLHAGKSADDAAAELRRNPFISGTGDKAGYSFEEVGGRFRRYPDEAGDKPGGFTSLNESAVSRWVQKVPGMTRSREGMETIVDQVVGRVYAREAESLWKSGVRDVRQYEGLAQVLNHSAGYGSWRAPDLIKGVNAFFSPRFLSSRIDLFVDPFIQFAKGNTAAGKLASKNLLAFAGTNVAVVEMGHQMGLWETTWDPLDTDFGKIRIGNTRIDTWAGVGPLVRFAARMSALGLNEVGVDTGYEYRGGAKGQLGLLVKDFVSGKLGPIPSFIAEATGVKSPYDDKGMLSPESLINRIAPFISQAIYDEMEVGSIGGWKGALVAGNASFWGAGTLAYPPTGTEQLNSILATVPPEERTNIEGKVVDNWYELSPAAQNAIQAKHPEIAAAIQQRNETSTSSLGAIAERVSTMRADAFKSFQQTGDGKAYLDALAEAGNEARIRYDQETKGKESEARSPEGKLLDAYFKEVVDAAGKDYELRDRLEAQFRARLSEKALAALDTNLQTSSDPNYAKLKAARDYLEQEYWPKRDDAYLKLVAQAVPGSPATKYPTYDELTKAANDRSSPDSQMAARLKQRVDSELSTETLRLRYQNPKVDSLLYIYGYTDTVLSPEAQESVRQWADANGVKLATPPLRVSR